MAYSWPDLAGDVLKGPTPGDPSGHLSRLRLLRPRAACSDITSLSPPFPNHSPRRGAQPREACGHWQARERLKGQQEGRVRGCRRPSARGPSGGCWGYVTEGPMAGRVRVHFQKARVWKDDLTQTAGALAPSPPPPEQQGPPRSQVQGKWTRAARRGLTHREPPPPTVQLTLLWEGHETGVLSAWAPSFSNEVHGPKRSFQCALSAQMWGKRRSRC